MLIAVILKLQLASESLGDSWALFPEFLIQLVWGRGREDLHLSVPKGLDAALLGGTLCESLAYSIYLSCPCDRFHLFICR